MSGGYNPLVLALLRKTKGLGQKAENLSIGLGHGLANQMEGMKQLATNPVAQLDMVNGLQAALSNPRQALESVLAQGKHAAKSPLNAGTFAGEMVNPRSLAAMLAKTPVMAGMTAYHGSPHDFDAFDSSKIGTGEGAQAYGHGLYFAEDQRVAKSYVDPLYKARDATQIGGLPYDDFLDKSRGIVPTTTRDRALFSKAMSPAKSLEEAAANLAELKKAQPGRDYSQVDALFSLARKEGVNFPSKGKFYNVDIPDEAIDKMLDWDAPLSEQPTAMKAFIDAGVDVEGGVFRSLSDRSPSPMTGRDAYDALAKKAAGVSFDGEMGQRKASAKLRELGITGIKYYDAASRGTKKGTRNFVVFDDKILKILSKE